MKTVAMLTKNYINSSLQTANNILPRLIFIIPPLTSFSYFPKSMHLFFKKKCFILTLKKTMIKIALLTQQIKQAVQPKLITAPLRLSLAVQRHIQNEDLQ